MLLPGLMNIQPTKTANIATANMIWPVMITSSICGDFDRAAEPHRYQLKFRIAERAHLGKV